MTRPHTTWSRHLTEAPAERAAPASEAEVVELVKWAAAARRHVKIVGGGHSFSDIGLTDGVLVTLDRMRAVVNIDAPARRVTVQASIRLHELIEALASRGLALPILGSVVMQSIAGAISTGTHGSSLQHANLASLVCGMRLVTGRGEVLTLDEADERLAAARVGLGALGVITQVMLRCEPLFTLAEDARRVPIDRLIRDLDTIARSAEYVKIWWLPTLSFANVYRYERTDQRPTTSVSERWIDEAVVNRFLFTGLLGASRRWPRLTRPINRAIGAAYLRGESRRVGRYDHVLTVAMPPVHRETEYAVAMEQAAEALGRVRALIERQQLLVNFVMEVRFVKGDDAWMSPAYGRDSCQIGAYIADNVHREAYFTGFERIMQTLGGRPHWGKEHNVTPEQVRALFPLADRFVALRRRLDPEGIFDNACLRRAIGQVGPVSI
ncbi:MAG: D-arabinono-1,4-lactone oxidase [bacterium]